MLMDTMLGKWNVTPLHEVGSCSASRGSGPKFSSRKRCPLGESIPLQILWRGSSSRSRITVSRPASTRRLAAAAAARLAPTMTTSAVLMPASSELREVQDRLAGKTERIALGEVLDHDALD